MALITARGLQKIYPSGVQGLANLDISINAGEMVGILGPSGSGKTTFFRLLNGSIIPTKGEIEVLGQQIGHISHKQLSRLRQRIALIYQNNNLIPTMSVAHNVLLGGLGRYSLFRGVGQFIKLGAKELVRINEILKLVGIDDKIYTRCSDLSGGQQQRVAVARAFFAEAEIILADEPISSVDMKTAELIMKSFQDMNKHGQTVILNLHQIDFALHFCSRLLVLNKGSLIFDGLPEQFINSEIYREKFVTVLGGDSLAG